MDLFTFDRSQLDALADRYVQKYRTAAPFPHIVIDDILPAAVLANLISEFPGPNDGDWHRFQARQEVKLASQDPAILPPFVQHVIGQLNSAAFIDFLERLTGIPGLIPDPHLWGGGLHQIERGGHLKVHADFNWHDRLLLDRRLNLLIYLNHDWQPEWGGDLELWDKDVKTCIERVAPLANRCVIFNTTDYAFHGHPDPLACPTDRTRRSLALYYYSNGRPASELRPAHTTDFRPRPGEQWRRAGSKTDHAQVRHFASRALPPAIVDAAKSIQRRIGKQST